MRMLVTGLAANLLGGLRVMLFGRVGLDELRSDPDQIVALVALTIIGQLLLGLGFNGLDGFFNTYAFAAEITVAAFALLAGFLVSRLIGEPRLLLGYPVVLLAMGPFFLALHGLLRWAGEGDAPLLSVAAAGNAYAGTVAWFLLAALVALLRLAPMRAAPACAGFGVYLALHVGSYWWLPPEDLWMARPAENAGGELHASVADEAAFHLQPALLERDLAALEPERPGVPDVYFVGFGAHSEEDVFMNEVQVIGELFRERFDAEGRTVALINNPKTAREVPLASATNLARVLRHLGAIMNPEEDVLVLYATSHGTEKHGLSVVNRPLRLDEIDPPTLRRMLDASGIKWRVLAISACYAGGFIEPLKGGTTLIMTAAHARKQSFGCGVQSEFTYFGKALFDEELRGTHSFVEAFERARRKIAERERAGNFEPSEPQIHIGGAIAGKLRELEARLRAPPADAAAAPPDG